MSGFIDRQYIQLISGRLRNFKWTSERVGNCSCPLCGDSKKNERKARGFFLMGDKGRYFFMCHNCGESMGISDLLKRIDPTMHKEYVMELFKDKKNDNRKKRDRESNPKMEFKKPVFKKTEKQVKPKESHMDLLSKMMPRLDTLPADHIAVQYVAERMIPEHQWSRMYYLDDFTKVEGISKSYKDKLRAEPRIVIPFFDANGRMEGLQGRALDDNPLRYVSLRIRDDSPMVFGMELLDQTKDINVLEGPIDSFFLPNSVAVGSSDLKKIKFLPRNLVRLIFDNQPRNGDLLKIIRRTIEQGYRVVIWPDTIEEKDVNEMVENGLTISDLCDIIDTRTYQGLAAMAAFNDWKKI